MSLARLKALLTAIAGQRVLVVGDLMVDRFVHGDVNRISAEAPIPILARRGESVMLGAAGNVARNLAALGGAVALVGVVGDDAVGHEAVALIGEDRKIEGFIVHDSGRPTTSKMRYVAGGQQLLRVDVEDVSPVTGEVEQRLIRAIGAAAFGVQAILLSDYGKGVVTDAVVAACKTAAEAASAILIVDSKARGFDRYGPADLVKPNAAELSFATDLPTGTDAEIEVALARALATSTCAAIMVTRGAQGMSLATRGGSVRHFVRPPAEVFDTSGAGDTALAAVGLALAAGIGLEEAVEFALLASSVVVEKAGTATASGEELLEAEMATRQIAGEGKIASPERMAREAARWRERGLTVGFTNGCFDMLHPGHIACLAQARRLCDRLIVGVNSDRSITALKGPGRPVNDLTARSQVLAGLESVDLVVAFDEATPLALIAISRPQVLVKGGDYQPGEVVGADLVAGWGGQVVIADFVAGHSTTATLKKLTEAP